MAYVQEILKLAAAGNKVFPCDPATKAPIGSCVPRGFLDATTKPEQILEWWSRYPTALIGRPEGEMELTVDVDPRNGGAESLKALIERQPAFLNAIKNTTIVVTRSAGLHIKFTNPRRYQFPNVSNLWPGIDFRSNGRGYLIIPPSAGWSFRNECARLDVPDSFWEAVQKRAEEKKKMHASAGAIKPPGTLIPEGERNQTLFRMACSMRKAGFCEDSISAALLITRDESCPTFSDAEVYAVAKSACKYDRGGGQIAHAYETLARVKERMASKAGDYHGAV